MQLEMAHFQPLNHSVLLRNRCVAICGAISDKKYSGEAKHLFIFYYRDEKAGK